MSPAVSMPVTMSHTLWPNRQLSSPFNIEWPTTVGTSLWLQEMFLFTAMSYPSCRTGYSPEPSLREMEIVVELASPARYSAVLAHLGLGGASLQLLSLGVGGLDRLLIPTSPFRIVTQRARRKVGLRCCPEAAFRLFAGVTY